MAYDDVILGSHIELGDQNVNKVFKNNQDLTSDMSEGEGKI